MGADALKVALTLAGVAFGCIPVQAQQNASPPAQSKTPPGAAKPVVGAPQSPDQTSAIANDAQASQLPDAVRLNLLIRGTLMALSQANQSGNYSVLRDLGAPAFQRFNSAAALAEKFADLRKMKVDFTPIFFFQPHLHRPPAFQDGRFLRLTGYMPTQPEKIDFDFAFQNIDGSWRIAALNVGMSRAQAKVSSAPAAGHSARQPAPRAGKPPAPQVKAEPQASAPGRTTAR
jgi:hypothetical protein